MKTGPKNTTSFGTTTSRPARCQRNVQARQRRGLSAERPPRLSAKISAKTTDVPIQPRRFATPEPQEDCARHEHEIQNRFCPGLLPRFLRRHQSGPSCLPQLCLTKPKPRPPKRQLKLPMRARLMPTSCVPLWTRFLRATTLRARRPVQKPRRLRRHRPARTLALSFIRSLWLAHLLQRPPP